MPGIANGAEAFPREVRGKRGRSICIHGWCISQPYGVHDQHGQSKCFPRHKLTGDTDIVANPAKAVVLTLNEGVPTGEDS